MQAGDLEKRGYIIHCQEVVAVQDFRVLCCLAPCHRRPQKAEHARHLQQKLPLFPSRRTARRFRRGWGIVVVVRGTWWRVQIGRQFRTARAGQVVLPGFQQIDCQLFQVRLHQCFGPAACCFEGLQVLGTNTGNKPRHHRRGKARAIHAAVAVHVVGAQDVDTVGRHVHRVARARKPCGLIVRAYRRHRDT